jgi:hypothetical protein
MVFLRVVGTPTTKGVTLRRSRTSHEQAAVPIRNEIFIVAAVVTVTVSSST